jgi:hypothetical protein
MCEPGLVRQVGKCLQGMQAGAVRLREALTICQCKLGGPDVALQRGLVAKDGVDPLARLVKVLLVCKRGRGERGGERGRVQRAEGFARCTHACLYALEVAGAGAHSLLVMSVSMLTIFLCMELSSFACCSLSFSSVATSLFCSEGGVRR